LVDFSIVLLWLYSDVLAGFFDVLGELPINAQVLRLARVARLLRLFRLIRTVQSRHFDSLYLITTALKGSLSILSWTCLMLLLFHLVLALLMNQIIREYYFNHLPDDILQWPDQAKDMYAYFGSFSRSLLTMFEISLANWPPACRLLVEEISEFWIVYALLHKLILGFAVLGVVNGVFIQETFKSASLDDAVMVRATRRRREAHNAKMQMLFEEANTDGDEYVSLQEWEEVCKDEWVSLWLASQDLNVQDAMTLFKMLDREGDDKLTAEELIEGAARLKGHAANLDMKLLMRDMSEALRNSEQVLEKVKVELKTSAETTRQATASMLAAEERGRSFEKSD
jgi:Ca2+-binding EF-hand superfamily protein